MIEEKDVLDTAYVHVINVGSTKPGVKLSKIILKKFSGNSLQGKLLQETYQAATENNNKLSAIEKFSYLQGYLKGTTFQAIGEFPLKVIFGVFCCRTQWAFTCSKLTIETLEQGVKYVQS